jgi:replicative DNA helicase
VNALPPSTGWGNSPPIDALPRTLPANVDAEQEILGVLIARPETIGIVAPILSAGHFTETVHASIYNAIMAAAQAGQTTSVAIIKQHVGDADLGGLTLGQYLGRPMRRRPQWASARRREWFETCGP